MKKIIALFVAVLITAAFAGCSGNISQPSESPSHASVSSQNEPETASGDLLEQIRQRGELVVAMEGTWSPWTYHDETEALVGYDVEVSRKIAEKLGVSVTFAEGRWDGLLAGLDAGRYDLLVNGVDITKERQEKYDFSTPYAYNHTVIIVTGDNEDIQSIENLAGKRTANTISGIYAQMAEDYQAEVVGVETLNQSFELLLAGRVDATLNDEVTYLDYLKAHPDANIKIAARTEDTSRVAIPMRKGEETASLREAIDQALEELRDSGELATLSEKYFGSDISKAG
ncbi:MULTISPECIES: transporter substrate-binding domain-containing protein [Anaerotruncus]|jgi:cystine transport system substrate-binding protein|uniref:Transporter substrate-binding domain-containing protein n=1 Tax=Anaerotruncus colihominis TaxID=169435 RepID=A0A845SXS5_9FIRM|nr:MULTISPECIES: transporter substrate-binding domain-containing protein [Anaerotruncus]MCI8493131.1 transporter substrate-binding domain-containing protein [Anaerotruncus sp.]MCR2024177.1 transporter substrate-binding domain-containing protein [Anaerotruncus colihominis]NDO39274.1 transporter substrate-binding domain-containing protein [Anaerotruncus colihominis]